MTELQLASLLKRGGFTREASWAIIRGCLHARSPVDRKGRQYFEGQVWDQLARVSARALTHPEMAASKC